MAMPKKPDHLARRTQVVAHVTKSERSAICRLARQRKATLSALVRDVLREAVRQAR